MIERLVIALLLMAGGWLAFHGVTFWQRRQVRVAPAGQPTILYFRSDSCAGCVGQRSMLSQLQTDYGSRFALRQIDADREPETAAAYRIMTLPTTIVADSSGAVRHINYGVTPAQRLAQQLESIL